MIDNEKLNTMLENGETIQWSGVARPYSVFDETRKKGTILSVCIALAWAALSIGGYYAAIASSGAEAKTGLVLFLLAISFFILWMPLSDKGKIKKLLYAITDKRVIIGTSENNPPITMPIADIDAIRLDNADNGNCHVRMGSTVFKAAPRKLPGLAYSGKYIHENDAKKYTGLLFYNVSAEDGKAISTLLEPAISSAKE